MNPNEKIDKYSNENADSGKSLHETIGVSSSDVERDTPNAEPLGERYELRRLHATGGMGRIWFAYDKKLDRCVALKDVRPERSGDAGVEARFLQEARITGRLEHPGIIPVYELENRLASRSPFYTMRFLTGPTLAESVTNYHKARKQGKAESFVFVELLNAFVMVCKTVAYAHSKGIVHRDLKGQNVVLGDFGDVVLLDWGLAKDISSVEAGSHKATSSEDLDSSDSGLTVLGQAVGTPAYMAPEQAAGQTDLIDQRTDVYGLGALLYEILTGQPPFAGMDAKEVLHKLQTQDVVPPRQLNENVPVLLEVACLKAMEKESTARYTSASDLAHEVEQWQEVQRKEAEKALQVSEALYHSLVEALPIALLRKDLDGRIVFVNETSATLFGTSADEIVGKTIADFFSKEYADDTRKEDENVIRTGEIIVDVFETAIDETIAYYISRKGPVRNENGDIIGVQSIFWDVTEQRTQELALLAERDELRAAVDVLQAKLSK